ncbi:MAG: hypothetical protein AB1736_09255, partial [Chloroflexota bacterium]
MTDRRAVDHGSHDLVLVARAAAGDLEAGETMAARDRLATCAACAALAADLAAIAAATRALGSSPRRAGAAAAGRRWARD